MTADERQEALGVTFQTKGWQEVIVPALASEIGVALEEWASGKRTKQDEGVTDEGLKQRVRALKWMLGWPENYKRTAEQLAAEKKVAEETEPPSEGGSPY